MPARGTCARGRRRSGPWRGGGGGGGRGGRGGGGGRDAWGCARAQPVPAGGGDAVLLRALVHGGAGGSRAGGGDGGVRRACGDGGGGAGQRAGGAVPPGEEPARGPGAARRVPRLAAGGLML